MTEHNEQFKPLRDITMTASERTAMRQRLSAFAQAHPVRSAWTATFARHAFAYVFSALALLVGTTTALAHQSRPGDLLYPLRLAVNERVAVAVAGDEDARVQKELDQIGRAVDDEDAAVDAMESIEKDETSPPAVSDEHDPSNVELDVELRAMERDIDQEEASMSTDLEI